MAAKSPKPRTLEEWLAALRAIDVAAAPELVRGALAVRKPGCGVVVASISKRIGEARAHVYADDLGAGFGSLLGEDAGKLDPGCRGKLAIATALHDLEHWDDRVFVVGSGVVQNEMTGDTAAGLRGLCGLAHAHFLRADALDVLATLLADPEVLARTAAAQGFGDAGRRDAAAVLRYKLLAASDEPDVLAACFDSLFHLAPLESAAFAIELLALDNDERAQSAALALGGARSDTAFEPLRAWSNRCTPDVRRRVGYVALALLRSDAANAVLLEVVRAASRHDALAAANALATFKHVDAIAEALRAAFATTNDRALRRELDALLD
jgi:hypothetical protein